LKKYIHTENVTLKTLQTWRARAEKIEGYKMMTRKIKGTFFTNNII